MNKPNMNRRDFLKIGALTAAGLFLPSIPLLAAGAKPAELTAGGLKLRGTQDGEIHLSRDGGQSWQLSSRLGKDFKVTQIFQDSAQRIRAEVVFSSQRFELVLDEGKGCWVTV
jgi:hypothetical protein